MKNEKLQNARQSWFSDFVENLHLDAPAKEISEKTGYDLSTVSLYLTKKRAISSNFLQAFCKSFKIDFSGLNHMLIDNLKEGIINEEKADNKTNSTKEKNSKNLYNDKDNLLSSPLTITHEDMHTLNLEMVRHIMEMSKQIVETNAVLARKSPDLKDGDVERKPLKERRA